MLHEFDTGTFDDETGLVTANDEALHEMKREKANGRNDIYILHEFFESFTCNSDYIFNDGYGGAPYLSMDELDEDGDPVDTGDYYYSFDSYQIVSMVDRLIENGYANLNRHPHKTNWEAKSWVLHETDSAHNVEKCYAVAGLEGKVVSISDAWITKGDGGEYDQKFCSPRGAVILGNDTFKLGCDLKEFEKALEKAGYKPYNSMAVFLKL